MSLTVFGTDSVAIESDKPTKAASKRLRVGSVFGTVRDQNARAAQITPKSGGAILPFTGWSSTSF